MRARIMVLLHTFEYTHVFWTCVCDQTSMHYGIHLLEDSLALGVHIFQRRKEGFGQFVGRTLQK